MRATAPANHFAGQNRVVGVIASPTALARAARLRRPPDLIELRLDALRHSLGEIERALPRLRVPLILTARHPAEGGRGRLSLAARRALLLRFLPHAAFVDLEFRSVRQMPALLDEIRRCRLGLIISRHDLGRTASLGDLRRFAHSAAAFHPAILKIATRTETPAELERLLVFFEEHRSRLPIAAMGLGRLGEESRRRLARLGSALTYISLDRPVVAGQPTLEQLRRARRAYIE
ncbi:MAG TPA: type I 3-dehydroquinate dehydratase [Chthoniobacterales bacterium]|jgi:3-dehydroquinate dehydratase-1|nr:type I 3-dehydroquinate dehydratase [Chthoniobacterales bacterium]